MITYLNGAGHATISQLVKKLGDPVEVGKALIELRGLPDDTDPKRVGWEMIASRSGHTVRVRYSAVHSAREAERVLHLIARTC